MTPRYDLILFSTFLVTNSKPLWAIPNLVKNNYSWPLWAISHIHVYTCMAGQPTHVERLHWDWHQSLLSLHPMHWWGCLSSNWDQCQNGLAGSHCGGSWKLKKFYITQFCLLHIQYSTLTSTYGKIFDFIIQIISIYIENNANVQDK